MRRRSASAAAACADVDKEEDVLVFGGLGLLGFEEVMELVVD